MLDSPLTKASQQTVDFHVACAVFISYITFPPLQLASKTRQTSAWTRRFKIDHQDSLPQLTEQTKPGLKRFRSIYPQIYPRWFTDLPSLGKATLSEQHSHSKHTQGPFPKPRPDFFHAPPRAPKGNVPLLLVPRYCFPGNRVNCTTAYLSFGGKRRKSIAGWAAQKLWSLRSPRRARWL